MFNVYVQPVGLWQTLGVFILYDFMHLSIRIVEAGVMKGSL